MKTKKPCANALSLVVAIAIVLVATVSLTACAKGPRSTWTDEDIVGHAKSMRHSYLIGAREDKGYIDDVGFELVVDGNEVSVKFPKGWSTKDGRTGLPPIVIGATYPSNFVANDGTIALGELISTYRHGEYWQPYSGGYTLATADYSTVATVDEHGILYVDGLKVGDVREYVDFVSIDLLCAEYRAGRWDGREVYDKDGNTASLSSYGAIVHNHEYTKIYPAVGTEADNIKDGFTAVNGNTVIIFNDGSIYTYYRYGNLVSRESVFEDEEVTLNDDTAILPRGGNYGGSPTQFDNSSVVIYIGTEEGTNLLVFIDTRTGAVTSEKPVVARLHGDEYNSVIVYLEGGTLYGFDRDWNNFAIKYGVRSIVSADHAEIVVELDNGQTWTYKI